MFVHIYLLSKLACSFFLVFGSSLGTGTGVNIAFFLGVKFFEPDILALPHFSNILLDGFGLLFIFVVTIVDDKFCEVLSDEKFLLYFFIECEAKAIVFLNSTAIVAKGTAA